jgi:putative membrane protein
LASGLETLLEGASSLNAGAVVLNSGLGTLQSGSGELVEGVTKLDTGAAELNDGMIQFNKDGINKLVDAFDGDVENLLANLNDILDASKSYKNFSGISEDMDGEVKFIFVTDK